VANTGSMICSIRIEKQFFGAGHAKEVLAIDPHPDKASIF